MKSPAFSLYVRDALCSTRCRRMTGDEFKAYWFLLLHSWLETPRATLPTDDAELACLANVSTEKWQTVRTKVLEMFLTGKDGRFYSERLMEVSEKQDNYSRSGKENARARWKKSKGHAKPHAKADAKSHAKNNAKTNANA